MIPHRDARQASPRSEDRSGAERSGARAGAALLSWVLLLMAAAGCEDPGSDWQPQEPNTGYAGAVMGRTVQQRPIVVERFGNAGPVVLLMHAIHGNEVPAEQCGQRMRSWLLTHPEAYQGLQVAFVSLLNGDGYVKGTRHNVNGIDLNRNFPASNFAPSPTFGPSPASEPETRLIVSLVQAASPPAIVTVHAPLDAINYDGPAEALAQQASDATGIRIDQDIGIYPGSFGSYAGVDLQIPTITLELPEAVANRAGFENWLKVEEIALSWVGGLGAQGAVALGDLVVDAAPRTQYETLGIGTSAGGRPLVAERFGPESTPVLVVAGLDGSDASVFVAERLRTLLLTRLERTPPQRGVVLVSLANPDGAAAGGGGGAEETALIQQLAAAQGVSAVVEIAGSAAGLSAGTDGDDAAPMLQALQGAISGSFAPLAAGRPGSIGAWAAGQGLPALSVGVPAQPGALTTAHAGELGLALQAAVEAAP